jgi:4a-hydroxytetrahydrobiopterin dehydratase
MDTIAQMQCAPYAGEPPLTGKDLVELHRAVPEWHVVSCDGTTCLQRDFTFPTFNEALAFTNAVGMLAESELHHPAILTEWGHVQVRWWTHALHGLHRNDFIMAAKTDVLYQQHTARERVRAH